MIKQTIKVTYRNLEGMHVFTSHDVPGLYVAHRDLSSAYNAVPGAIFDATAKRYKGGVSASGFVGLMSRSSNLELPVILAANNILFNQSA